MTKQLVKDWMTSDPITVDGKTTLTAAYHLMRLNRVRRLLVVDSQDRLLGILTWGDVREAKPKHRPPLEDVDAWATHFLTATMEVSEIMTPNPVTVTPEMLIHEAAGLMLKHKIGGLPVVADGRVVGVLTESDIYRFVVENTPQQPGYRT
jgi:CBS domain-containing protein